MKLDDLQIPKSLKFNEERNLKKIVSLEGVDASGKSTLSKRLSESISFCHFIEINKFFTSLEFKEFIFNDANKMINALLFSASLIDRKQKLEHLENISHAVMDRSIWSTVAITWIDEPFLTQTVLNLFGELATYLPIPDYVFVLDVSYERCRKRVKKRSEREQKFDEMNLDVYDRHMNFYKWLSRQNVGVTFINADYDDYVKKIENIEKILRK